MIAYHIATPNESEETKMSKLFEEKVRAGQPYLYRKNGLPSEVYEVRFLNEIDHDRLDSALGSAIDRYPYFKVRYREHDGDFCTVYNDLPMNAVHSDKLPALGGSENNYYLIAVSHYGRSVFVSFHHGLTDGRGIKSFVETLVYYYCCKCFGTVEAPEGVLTNEIPFSESEIAEPCGEKYIVRKKEKIEGLSRKGFTLPETEGKKTSHRRYELSFSQEEFIGLCKSHGGSPVTMLSVMMSRAVNRLYPDCGKVIKSNFPVDVRRELGVEGTYKNCVKSISLPYGEKERDMSADELCAHYKMLMNAQRTADHCRAEFNNIIMLLNILDHLHSYKKKRAVLRFLDDLKLDTYLISYIGQFAFGANERYIDSVHLFSNCSDGLVLNMTCACGRFNIDFVQDFDSEKYITSLCEEFAGENIAISVSDEIEFETPLDHLMRDMPYAPAIIDRRTLWQKTVDANVTAYHAVEKAAVSSMTAVTDGFVKLFLMKDDETLNEAKLRLRNEQEQRFAQQAAVSAPRLPHVSSRG